MNIIQKRAMKEGRVNAEGQRGDTCVKEAEEFGATDCSRGIIRMKEK